MSDSRHPSDRLDPTEADRVREIVENTDLRSATRYFGLRSTEALAKAIARLPVHRLTAQVIRNRLGRDN